MLWRNALKISHTSEFFHFEETCSKIIHYCNKQSLKEGVCVHSPAIKACLQYNLLISNNLLSLYRKCYGVEYARQLFDEMPSKVVVSWSGLLSAYVKDGSHEEALELFDLMKISGEYPNEFTLSSVFRACSALRDSTCGTKVQAYATKNGLDFNPILTSSLMDFYSKCDNTEEAYKVFIEMENAVMISAFVEEGNWIKGLRLFIHMIKQRVSPNEYTFAKIFSACRGLVCINYGKLVHAQMIVWGVRVNLFLKTALADMYAKCQRMEDALKVSKQTPEQDVLLWTALVSGFAQKLKVEEAIETLQQMEVQGTFSNNYTYAGISNVCFSTLALQLGKQVHSKVIKLGLGSNVSVGNALIDMYTKCSDGINDAIKVFEWIMLPNVVSWTSLIVGFIEHGLEGKCFQAFEEMQLSGVAPSSFTVSSTLQACGVLETTSYTRKLHGYIIKRNMGNDVVANTLIDTYAGFHMFDDAWCIVRAMTRRDSITYTCLATRLNQVGYHQMALRVISNMQQNDIPMDGFAFSSFLSASTSLGAIRQGMHLHCHAIKSGLSSSLSVSYGLIDSHGKCGYTDCAQKAFEETYEADVVLWNSLMFVPLGHCDPVD